MIARAVVDEAEPSLSYLKALRTVVASHHLNESQYGGLYLPLMDISRQSPTHATDLILLCGPLTTRVDAVLIGYLAGGLVCRENESVVIPLDLASDARLMHLATIIAIRVAYDEEPLEYVTSIRRLCDSNDLCPDSANHLVHLALDHYAQDPEGWFSLIEQTFEGDLTSTTIHTCFFRLAYSARILEPAHLFGLIRRNQDDGSILDDMSTTLLLYADHPVEVMDLVFAWIASGRINLIGPRDHFLKELASVNSMVIIEYVRRYVAWCRVLGSSHPPDTFSGLAEADLGVALEAIREISPLDPVNYCAILELARVLVNCFADNLRNALKRSDSNDLTELLVNYFAANPHIINELQSLYQFLKEIDGTHLSRKSDSSIMSSSGPLAKGQYDQCNRLVDAIDLMLKRLEGGPILVDIPAIRQVLTAYPTLESLVAPLLKKFERTNQCSPFVDLFASATPSDGVSNGPFRIEQASALLQVFEKGSQLYISHLNGRHATSAEKENRLKKDFGNSERFWTLLAEHLLFVRLEQVLVCVDCVIGNDKSIADIDLEVKLDGARVFIEVIVPQEQRAARLSNEASIMSSGVASAIEKKYKDMMKSGVGAQLERDTDGFYFIAIDTTQLPLPKIDATEGIFGPLMLEYGVGLDADPEHDRLFRDHRQSELNRSPHAPLISGVILFSLKYQEKNDGYEAGIHGDVVNNPWTVKRLSPTARAELSRMLFE